MARSINIDDIESVLNTSVWKPQNYSKKNSFSYMERKDYTANICYPYIYQIEVGTSIDDVYIEEGKRNRKK